MSRIPVAIFARAPIPGRCKTRLAAAIGEDRAAALYAAFVEDTVERCVALDLLAPALHVVDTPEHPFFTSLAERYGLRVTLQREGHLGLRMYAALDRSLVLGTDAPTISTRILEEAARALERFDLVLSPAADGGYVLIGAASRADAEHLARSEIRWSSPHALADTIRAAGQRSIALTPPHYDVDDRADLALLATHLALDPDAAPRTAHALAALEF